MSCKCVALFLSSIIHVCMCVCVCFENYHPPLSLPLRQGGGDHQQFCKYTVLFLCSVTHVRKKQRKMKWAKNPEGEMRMVGGIQCALGVKEKPCLNVVRKQISWAVWDLNSKSVSTQNHISNQTTTEYHPGVEAAQVYQGGSAHPYINQSTNSYP